MTTKPSTPSKPRRQLDEDQKQIQAESRNVVKIIGLLNGLSDPSLDMVIQAATRRHSSEEYKPEPEA